MNKLKRLFFKHKISQLESVLGVKLEDWQISYIFDRMPEPIAAGAPNRSLIYALRQLLSTSSRYLWKLGGGNSTVVPFYSWEDYSPISDDRGNNSSFYHRDYLIKWRKLFSILHEADIPTAQVVWDLHRGGAVRPSAGPGEGIKEEAR